MSSKGTDGDAYEGAAGRTHTLETTVWCGGCGAHFGAHWQAGIDADETPELLARFREQGWGALNTARCPSCADEYVVHEPLLVHRRGARSLTLVVPEGWRHRVGAARAEAARRIGAAPGQLVPEYALHFDVVVGPPEEAPAVDPPTRPASPAARPGAAKTVKASASKASRLAPIERPTAELHPSDPGASAERLARARPAPPLPGREPPGPPVLPATPAPTEPAEESAVSVDLSDLVVGARPAERKTADAEPDAAPVEPTQPKKRGGLLAELMARAPEPPPPPVPAEADDERWEALDEGWNIEAPAPAQADDDPTHVVAIDEVAERQPAGPSFAADKAGGRDGYVHLHEGKVTAVVRLEAARAQAFEEGVCELRFQLHQPTLPNSDSGGPVMALLLVRVTEDGEPGDHVFWLLEHETAEHRKVLDALAERFVADVAFHTPDGDFHGRRTLRSPLAANVRSAREAVQRAESERIVDRGASRLAVLADDYDRLGRLKHSFHQHSFDALSSAAEARLAIGILSYWSAPERRDYLLRIKAFPERWFEAMTRRILEGALNFGLAMEPHMRQRALDLGLAPNSAALVRRSLANFAEVNLNIKPSDLDPLDIWDNWEALLAHAEELDLHVDEDIEELAARAMDRAREAAQALDPIEISADDDSIEMEEVADLSELDDVDLVGLLHDPSHRLEAALALLQQGEAVYVQTLFDAIKLMQREELLRAVPAALAMGPQFEQHFINGLRARRVSLRLASALFLAEIRSERAAAPLLALLPSAGEAEWPILARAAARMGRRILKPALRQVSRSGDADGRVAHTLALLGADARGALSAARDKQADPAAVACLTQALDQMGEVSFADAADFTERLADAFEAAGPDDVGPDFEEELVSIDLGPAASVGDLETEVSLDGIEE